MKYALYQAPDTTDAPGEIIICDDDGTYMGEGMDIYVKAGWKLIGCIESDINYFGIIRGFEARWAYQRKNIYRELHEMKTHLVKAEDFLF